METTVAVHPYLDGNFAPIDKEITTDTLQVIGELPPDLSGMFVRNGSNPQWTPIGKYHWFDGDGMLHGVRISKGIATYRNRYVRTRKWQLENQKGKAIWSGLLEPPQKDTRAVSAQIPLTRLLYGMQVNFWRCGKEVRLMPSRFLI